MVGLASLVSVYWDISSSSVSVLEVFCISLTDSYLSVSILWILQNAQYLFMWAITVCFVRLVFISRKLLLHIFCNFSVTSFRTSICLCFVHV